MATSPVTRPAPDTRARPLDGPAAAAILAAGVGAAALGLLTTLAEASTGIRAALVLNTGVGPLSGKTVYAVVAWLAAWLLLQLTVARRTGVTRAVLTITAILIALGVLGTFPLFFQAFEPG